jgi:hypothetical protein
VHCIDLAAVAVLLTDRNSSHVAELVGHVDQGVVELHKLEDSTPQLSSGAMDRSMLAGMAQVSLWEARILEVESV